MNGKLKAVVSIAPVIVTVVAVTGVAAAVVLYNYPQEWLTVLNVGLSAILTSALVSLYYGQLSVLQSQEDLKRTEMNLEIRRQHTEVLRKRVVAWHGNTEPTQMPDNPLPVPQNSNERGLPEVRQTGFRSAPKGVDAATYPENRDFQVVPEGLQNDAFLNDFINNHVNEVNQVINDIDRYQTNFANLRSQFADSLAFDFGPVDESYEIQWADRLPIWIFNELLKFSQRPEREGGRQDRYQSVSSYIEYMIGASLISDVQPQENTFTIRYRDEGPIVAVVELCELEPTDIGRIEDDVMVYFRSRFRSDSKSIIETWPDQTIARALRELHRGEEAIEELEEKLEQYEGVPIYDGSCKYIENADVSNW